MKERFSGSRAGGEEFGTLKMEYSLMGRHGISLELEQPHCYGGSLCIGKYSQVCMIETNVPQEASVMEVGINENHAGRSKR